MSSRTNGRDLTWIGFSMLSGLLGLCGIASAGVDSLERAFAVPGHGTLRLEVPAMWQTTLSDTPEGGPPTIQFAAISGGGFLVLVTPMGLASAEESRHDPAANRQVVEEWGAENLEGAVEEPTAQACAVGARLGAPRARVTGVAPLPHRAGGRAAGTPACGPAVRHPPRLINSSEAPPTGPVRSCRCGSWLIRGR